MIIGSGLLANELNNYLWPSDCLVLAFGVSNSLEIRESEFVRDSLMVERCLMRTDASKIVFFSSSNVACGQSSPYVSHKIKLEELVKSSGKDYHIFRLSQVVGAVVNTTLVSFLVQKALDGSCINIHRDAKRYLIGVDDVAYLVADMVNKEFGVNSVVNIASGRGVLVEEIALEISRILDKAVSYKVVEGGFDAGMSIEFLRGNYPDHRVVKDGKYWACVLKRYVPIIAKNIMDGRF